MPLPPLEERASHHQAISVAQSEPGIEDDDKWNGDELAGQSKSGEAAQFAPTLHTVALRDLSITYL